MNKEEYKVYNLGNVKLLSEQVLKSATLAYQTYGVLNSKKDNVILLPAAELDCLNSIAVCNPFI